MDIRNLRQVLAIHRTGSIASAAASLGLSQPSLSISLARLEDELGAKVFYRSATGCTATSVGQAILARAEQLITEVDGLTRHATLVGGGHAVQLRLGIALGLGPLMLPDLIEHISETCPDLRLHIETATGYLLLAKFERNELDLIVCGNRSEIHRPHISLAEVGETRIVAIASPDHPLAAARSVDPRTLSKYKNVGSLTSAYSTSSFFNFEDSWYMPTVVTNDPLTFPGFVSAGYIVVTAEAFVSNLLSDGQAVEIDLNRESVLSIYLVGRESTRNSPVVENVFQAIIKAFPQAYRASAHPDAAQ